MMHVVILLFAIVLLTSKIDFLLEMRWENVDATKSRGGWIKKSTTIMQPDLKDGGHVQSTNTRTTGPQTHVFGWVEPVFERKYSTDLYARFIMRKILLVYLFK
jgi:hypothetical protein